MSRLRTFRIDGHRLDRAETEFFAKIEDDEGRMLGTFDMTGDGIYYYRPGSQILTGGENENTRASFDGYVSFEDLKEIFEILNRQGWNRDTSSLDITDRRNTVVLTIENEEEE